MVLFGQSPAVRPCLTRSTSVNTPSFRPSEKTPLVQKSGGGFEDGNSVQIQDDVPKIGDLAASFNIFNIFVGINLLSVPYACMQGGLVSLGWLLISCIVASWTGKLLVACAQKMDFFNYPRLGHLVSGKNGEYIVVLFITLEFIGIVCCKTIFMWGHLDLLMQLLGFDVSELTYIFFSTALVCTTFFKVNVSEFAALNALGTFASFCIVFTVIIIFSCSNNINHGEINWFDIWGFSMSSGIYAIALAGHAVLPSVYVNMKTPSHFDNMLDWTFVVMFLVFCFVAFFGYGIAVENTNIQITFNVRDTGYTIMTTFMILVVLIALMTSLCPTVAVLCELPEEYLGWTTSPKKQISLRLSSYISCVLLSYFCRNALASFASTVGGFCTVWTSIILPIYFYNYLHKKEISRFQYLRNQVLCWIAVALSIVWTIQNVHSFFVEQANGAAA